MRHATRGLAMLLCTAAMMATAGCGQEPETPEQALADLAERLGSKVRAGWKVGRVRDVSFAVFEERVDVGDLHPYGESVEPNDIVVWRSEPVRLQERADGSAPDPNPGHVYFILSRKEFIAPGDYVSVRRKNDDALKERKWLLRDVAHVSRDAEGNLSPRGAAEATQVTAFRGKYEKLPSYNAFDPQYHHACVGIRLRDYRTVLVPVERDHRQEMNQTYVEIVQILSAYEQ